jgi:hypothetical protein
MSAETEDMLRIAAFERAIDQERFAEAVALYKECQCAQAMSLLAIAEAVLEEEEGHSDTVTFCGDPGNVTFLALFGADLNARDVEDGSTPLMCSSLEGLVDVVERLVELGADLNMTDAYGNTALFCSVMQGHYETMHFLLKAGATSEGVDHNNDNIWDILIFWLEKCQDVADIQGEVLASQALLMEPLKILIMQRWINTDQYVYLVRELLEPELRFVMNEGIALRERMPRYLRHRQAVLESRRSRIFSLPLGVRELIHSFEGPFTAEEI